MDIIVADDYADLSVRGAHWVRRTLRGHPDATFLPATGNTPLGLYRELAKAVEGAEADFSRLRVFGLDDYCGITPHDPRSLYRWTVSAFLEPLHIPEANATRLRGDASDLAAACRAYDEAVAAAGGIYLTVLGIGPNGHLGYNEPPSYADSPTRVVTLTPESLASSQSYWEGGLETPRTAITAGLSIILAAQHILLLASGAAKADIVDQALQGPVTPQVPASFLQNASDVTVIVDRAAGASLR